MGGTAVTGERRSLRRLAGTTVPEPAAATPVTTLPDGGETTQRIGHAQITEWSPAGRFRFTTEVCPALLDAVQVSAERLAPPTP